MPSVCHRFVGCLGLLTLASLPTGCTSTPADALRPPRTLVAPYDTSRGEVLWAVAPLRNESGVPAANIELITDKLVAAAEEAEGVRALPLNRTLAAMQALKMNGVGSPADARLLAQTLGVDAVLVGSLTAFDPYAPTIGLAVALYPKPGAYTAGRTALNPRELQSSVSDQTVGRIDEAPLTSTSMHLDGKNHQVLMDVESFADGRLKQPSALGWRRYLASADLFSEFAAYRVVGDLLRQEWVRLGRAQVSQTADGRGRSSE